MMCFHHGAGSAITPHCFKPVPSCCGRTCQSVVDCYLWNDWEQRWGGMTSDQIQETHWISAYVCVIDSNRWWYGRGRSPTVMSLGSRLNPPQWSPITSGHSYFIISRGDVNISGGCSGSVRGDCEWGCGVCLTSGSISLWIWMIPWPDGTIKVQCCGLWQQCMLG